jgi:hypothetical protein
MYIRSKIQKYTQALAKIQMLIAYLSHFEIGVCCITQQLLRSRDVLSSSLVPGSCGVLAHVGHHTGCAPYPHDREVARDPTEVQ